MSDISDPLPCIWDQALVHDDEFKPHNPKDFSDPKQNFLHNLNTPAPVSYRQDKCFVENGLPNKSNGVSAKESESNGEFMTKGDNIAWPVVSGESGEGLPYAPVGWPNPGDNWTWRVGRRYNNAGYFHERFLYPPKHIHKATGGKILGSKPAIERYIHTYFPGADVNAFFASYTWEIPVKLQTPTKVEDISIPVVDTPQVKKEKVKEIKRDTRRSGRPRKNPPENMSESVYAEGNEEITPPAWRKRKKKATMLPSTSRQKYRQSFKWSTATKRGSAADREHVTPEEFAVVLFDFDNYLNSLDDIITQPLTESMVPNSTTDSYSAEDEMAEARSKLSSLLVMDFPSLVSFKHFSELISLASKLRKNPHLSAEQLVKLKLIEEIPSFSEVFRDSREIMDQIDKMFAALEANKTKVTNLKSEYNELKEKADELQLQVDSSLVAVKDVDNKIVQLQNWRAEVTSKIESNREAKVEVNLAEKAAASEIPTVVQKIQ